MDYPLKKEGLAMEKQLHEAMQKFKNYAGIIRMKVERTNEHILYLTRFLSLLKVNDQMLTSVISSRTLDPELTFYQMFPGLSSRLSSRASHQTFPAGLPNRCFSTRCTNTSFPAHLPRMPARTAF